MVAYVLDMVDPLMMGDVSCEPVTAVTSKSVMWLFPELKF